MITEHLYPQGMPTNEANNSTRLTLREQQVLQLRREISHSGGVRLQLRRKDCLGSIALVDAFNAVWFVCSLYLHGLACYLVLVTVFCSAIKVWLLMIKHWSKYFLRNTCKQFLSHQLVLNLLAVYAHGFDYLCINPLSATGLKYPLTTYYKIIYK